MSTVPAQAHVPAGGVDFQRRPRARSRAHGTVPLAVTGALLVAVVISAGVLINSIDAERRETLTDRIETRHALASDFVSAYVNGIMVHERRLAESTMTGPVSAETFERIAAENGYAAAVLLDQDGRALGVAPAAPELLGEALGERYTHLAGALLGTPAVSGVVVSAAEGDAIVAFAVPFDSPSGRRVFSAGHRLGETPLTPFIGNALSLRTSRVLLLDGDDIVIASSDVAIVIGNALAVGSDLREAADTGGYHQVDGHETFSVVDDVAGTGWRLVFTVDAAELFATVSGPGRWVPWGILAAFCAASVAALALWRRAQLERRSRLTYEQRLHDLALSDSLTGLANRRVAVDRLHQALGRAHRLQNKVAVLYIDVDRFKMINDHDGHAVGDAVLVIVAHRLRATFRVEDTIARLGGDEFVVICEDQTDVAAIDELAARTRTTLAQPCDVGEGTVPCSASVGVTTASTGESPETVLARADRAMYEAKADHRDLRALEAATAAGADRSADADAPAHG